MNRPMTQQPRGWNNSHVAKFFYSLTLQTMGIKYYQVHPTFCATYRQNNCNGYTRVSVANVFSGLKAP